MSGQHIIILISLLFVLHAFSQRILLRNTMRSRDIVADAAKRLLADEALPDRFRKQIVDDLERVFSTSTAWLLLVSLPFALASACRKERIGISELPERLQGDLRSFGANWVACVIANSPFVALVYKIVQLFLVLFSISSERFKNTVAFAELCGRKKRLPA